MKDRYINYDESIDKFVERAVSIISSIIKQFVIYQAYFEFENDPEVIKSQFDIRIKENMFRKQEVPNINFTLNCFLFVSVCYYRDLLNENIQATIYIRGSLLFVAEGNLEMRKYAVVNSKWSKTVYTPLYTVISTCVLIILVL